MRSPDSRDRPLLLQLVASEVIPPPLLAGRTEAAVAVVEFEVGRVLMKLIEPLAEVSNCLIAPTHSAQTTGRDTSGLRSSSSSSAWMPF